MFDSRGGLPEPIGSAAQWAEPRLVGFLRVRRRRSRSARAVQNGPEAGASFARIPEMQRGFAEDCYARRREGAALGADRADRGCGAVRFDRNRWMSGERASIALVAIGLQRCRPSVSIMASQPVPAQVEGRPRRPVDWPSTSRSRPAAQRQPPRRTWLHRTARRLQAEAPAPLVGIRNKVGSANPAWLATGRCRWSRTSSSSAASSATRGGSRGALGAPARGRSSRRLRNHARGWGPRGRAVHCDRPRARQPTVRRR